MPREARNQGHDTTLPEYLTMWEGANERQPVARIRKKASSRKKYFIGNEKVWVTSD